MGERERARKAGEMGGDKESDGEDGACTVCAPETAHICRSQEARRSRCGGNEMALQESTSPGESAAMSVCAGVSCLTSQSLSVPERQYW